MQFLANKNKHNSNVTSQDENVQTLPIKVQQKSAWADIT